MMTAYPRDKTFHVPDGLVLMGGYPMGGGSQEVSTNPTILSGDIGKEVEQIRIIAIM